MEMYISFHNQPYWFDLFFWFYDIIFRDIPSQLKFLDSITKDINKLTVNQDFILCKCTLKTKNYL